MFRFQDIKDVLVVGALIGLGIMFAVLVGGCAPNTRSKNPTYAPIGARWTVEMRQYTARESWLQSGYFRPERDAVINLPVIVALDGNGMACILTQRQVFLWDRPQYVVCSAAWRLARP